MNEALNDTFDEAFISVRVKTVRYKSQIEPTLFDISIDIRKGEKILIAGKSGSGKSTLAHMLNGLIPHAVSADIDGSVRVGKLDIGNSGLGEVSKRVGTVLQDPDGQFVGLSVGEDIAFSLENDYVPLAEMHKRVFDTAKLVYMETMLRSSPQELSGGQKQRVTVAGVMVDDVEVLLFDEPLANLDPATGKYAIELIDDIHENTGKTIIIIEHRIEDVLHRSVDRVILLEEGRVVCQLPPAELLQSDMLRAAGLREPLYLTALRLAGLDPRVARNIEDIAAFDAVPFRDGLRKWFYATPATTRAPSANELLRVDGLRHSYANGAEVLKGVGFTLQKGEIVALLGRNGAGKSTLASVICGMESPASGAIYYKGADIAPLSIADRAKRIGFVMQDPNHMLSKPMLYDEVALGLKARGVPEAETRERVYEALRVCGLYQMRNWPVSALSFGQKKRVTVAAVLVLGCELLILDEPTAGQDYTHYTEIMEFLLRLNADTGLTMLFITHDMHLAIEYTNRALVMTDGIIIADRPVAGVFGDDAIIGRASLKRTSLYELAEKAGLPPEQFIARFIRCEREARDAKIGNNDLS